MNCCRCLTPTLAVRKVSLTVDSRAVVVPVCRQHSRLFDGDMAAWLNVATPTEAIRQPLPPPLPAPSPVPDEPVQRVYSLRPASEVDELDVASAMESMRCAELGDWSITDHAIERALERDVPFADIAATVLNPQWTADGNRPDAKCYYRNGIKVVVNPRSRTIITTAWMTETGAKPALALP